MLADKLSGFDCDSVISPALGGIIVGQEVGRSLGKRHIFTEKENGKLALRRGFKIDNGGKFIVVEDVVTRGGRVQETIDIVRAHGAVVTAVGLWRPLRGPFDVALKIADACKSREPEFISGMSACTSCISTMAQPKPSRNGWAAIGTCMMKHYHDEALSGLEGPRCLAKRAQSRSRAGTRPPCDRRLGAGGCPRGWVRSPDISG